MKRGISNGNEETLLHEAIYQYLPNAIIGSKSGLKVVLWKANIEDQRMVESKLKKEYRLF